MLFAVRIEFFVRIENLVTDLLKGVFCVCRIVLGCIHDLREFLYEFAEVGIQIVQLLYRVVVKRFLPGREENLRVISLHKDDADAKGVVQPGHFLIKVLVYLKRNEVPIISPTAIGQSLEVVLFQLII